jgi:hypothetical protein
VVFALRHHTHFHAKDFNIGIDLRELVESELPLQVNEIPMKEVTVSIDPRNFNRHEVMVFPILAEIDLTHAVAQP